MTDVPHTIVLDHTVVRTSDKERGARFLADLLGLEVGAPTPPFLPVRVNEDLTLDFDDRLEPAVGHWAFLVDDVTFDRALDHVRRGRLEHGSSPRQADGRINHLGGGRGVYVRDPDGNAYELFTARP